MSGASSSTSGGARQGRPPVGQVIVDGVPLRARWGYVAVTPRELVRLTGRPKATIHLYPPGVTRRVRRMLHWRNFAASWTGLTLTGLALVACLAVWSVLGLAIGATVLAVIYGSLILGPHRTAAQIQTVSLSATLAGMLNAALYGAVAAQLDALDEAGHDPVQYEAEWWRIYRVVEKHRRSA